MKIGSLFSGIGGLDLACEWALGGRTVWQLDQVGAAVRRRHWPDALQVEADVRDVDPRDLPAVDVLCGGFACQDLSCAGLQAGLLDGERTGPTYRALVRFTAAMRPALVVMENVPALLSKWRVHLEHDWGRMGYGLTWAPCAALDVGAPHLRRRVFVVARLGEVGRGVVEVPTDGRWTAERDEREWATITASEDKGRRVSIARRANPDMLTEQVRPWPTTVGDAKASGSRCLDSDAHPGTSLTDAIRPDRTTADDVRPWPTPTVQDGCNTAGPSQWARNSDALNVAAVPRPGKRLNPAWVEGLMGLPTGWTLPTGPRLTCSPSPLWPRGRYPESWDRSVLWPGYGWEPHRTLPDGPPVRGRPARIRALGNAVVPQQGARAITTALEPVAQTSLFQSPQETTP